MHKQKTPFFAHAVLYGWPIVMMLLLLTPCGFSSLANQAHSPATPPTGGTSVSQAFAEAAQEFQVPASLLKAICYMEGHLSNNGGRPSLDNGFGCMHLVQNDQVDTLDRAARETGVSVNRLKQDIASNIRGGAVLLRDDARQLSRTHQLPTAIGDWYGAVAAYSHSTTRSTALLYADAVYSLLAQGFSAQADDGETITLEAQAARPNLASAATVTGSQNLPSGCRLDQHVDYPGAIDCILPAHTFDCNITPTTACNFTGSTRPTNCTIDYSPTNVVVTKPCAVDQIVIHDMEGTVTSALDVFQNPQSAASAHYILDSNGTIYQVVRDKDIAYHDGNFWYNQHSIGIEHAGYDATGYRWYNAAEYLASAKLVAHLLRKYNLPLDRAHILAHGTVPAPMATSMPNHVDPGPYWLWDYYFKLIHQYGGVYPVVSTTPNIFTLRPASDLRPFGNNGSETTANFNFFYLYNGPSTASGLIPQQGNGSDITDVSGNVEPGVSYYYLAKVADPAGSGDTMYKIWYGVEDVFHSTRSSIFAHARLAWLAVPRGAASPGEGIAIRLLAARGQTPQIYSQPTSSSSDVIGSAPAGAIFASTYTLVEDNTNNHWYEIDFNHRQGWVPANEVTPL